MDNTLLLIKFYLTFLAALLFMLWCADRASDFIVGRKPNILNKKSLLLLLLVSIVLFLAVTGCTKTIYVPSTPPQPMPIREPIDYLNQLSLQSTPTQFVKACLATRLDYRRAYEQCRQQLNVYVIPASLD